MIQVYADGVIVYDSRVEDYDLVGLSRTAGLNKGGTAEIVMPHGHPGHNLFTSYRTVVEIYRDGTLLFRGRPIYPADDYYNQRTITCEGELCFFRDGVSRPYLYQDSPAAIFTALVTMYNTQVEAFKQFTVGEITVTDSNDYVRLESSSPESVLDTINKLVERCGGYIVFTTDASGARVVNWYAELDRQSNQEIEFGENLLSYSRDGANTDLCTAVLPYGAKDDDGNRLTITSVNGGLDYIKDEETAALRGTIYHYPIWDDVTEPGNLLTKAQAYLEEHRYAIDSLELTALDLSYLDKSLDSFQLGDLIRVVSVPHGVDETFQLTELSEDLLNPANSVITLGKERSTLTGADVAAGVTSKSELQQAASGITTEYTSALKSAVTEMKTLVQEITDSIILGASGELGGELTIALTVNGEMQAKTVDLSKGSNMQLTDTSLAGTTTAEALQLRGADGVLYLLTPNADGTVTCAVVE